MKSRTLLQLKSEIITCKNENRLLDLEINLKHFITIFSYKLGEDSYYSEEDIKDLKNSISLAKSYLSVISWKLENAKIDREIEKIEAITKNKKEIFNVLESGLESFLANHSTMETLKKENSKLKRRINVLNMRLYSAQNSENKNEM